MKPRSKSKKRLHGREAPQQDSVFSSQPRQHLCTDLDVVEVTPGKQENKLRPAAKMECAGEGTSTGEDVEMKSQTEVSMDPVSSLPSLVKDKMFGFLNPADKVKAAQVCWTWRDTIHDPHYWRHEKIQVNLGEMTAKSLSSVAERKAGSVQICGDQEEKMKYFLKKHTSMITLHLSSAQEANIFLRTMSCGQFSSLTQLTLTTDDNACQALSSQQTLRMLPNLRTLSIHGTLSNDLIQTICGELRQLEELSLNCPSLWTVKLCIQDLAQLHSLHTLTLEFVTVQDFSRFCEFNKTLRKLRMKVCILDEDWLTDLSQLTSLDELDLRGCIPDIQGLEPLSQKLVNLKKVTIWSAENNVVGSVGSLSTVEEVELLWTTNVEVEDFHALSNSLPHLKALTLSRESCITSEGLVQFGGIQTLQKLHLDGVTHSDCISDFLKSLSQSSCRLKSLTLTQFPKASRQDMENIGKVSTLQELSLGGLEGRCWRLMELQYAKFQLEVLELRNCKVTIEDLLPLLAKQISLRKLVVVGNEIYEKKIPSLHSLFPNLEVLVLK